MSQSLSKNYIHLVFHTKNCRKVIRDSDKQGLYAYIGSVLKDNECIPVSIGGVSDHVHVLFVLSKNISLSKIVELVKKHSSRWVKTIDPVYKDFSWQGGYGAFSVSQSVIEKTKNYIKNQEEHHKKKSYREEVESFLKEFELAYDPDYFWKEE